jgi:hypothetical protein
MAKDFYCQYGKHWADKSAKLHTPRQGDYICSECEDERTLHQFKTIQRHRRKDDDYDDENE